MPFYEYQCRSCGHRLEVLQKLSDEPLVFCPECNESALKKLISAAGFRLKGTGWYETDFKSNNKKDASKDDKSSGDKAASDKADSSGSKGDNSKPASPDSASSGKSGSSGSADSSGSKKSKGDSSNATA